jgi:hypothetical protein
MLRNRAWVLLGVCLLSASAALADDLGVVDCAKNADQTPVFAKPRKSNDILATVPCGERFRIVQYGFIFSEIQTADGKVGFIYSNVITVERAGGTLQMRAPSTNATPTATTAAEKTKIYAPKDTTAQPAAAQPAAPAQAAASVTPAASATTQSAAAVAQPSVSVTASVSAASPSAPAAPATPAAAPAPASAPPSLPGAATVISATTSSATSADAPASASAAPAASAAAAQPATPEITVAAPSAPAADSAAAAASPAPAPASNAAAPAPSAPATAAPEAAVEPAPITDPKLRRSWDVPNSTSRSASLLELYGGASYALMNSTGSGGTHNFIGFMGSFGLNLKPWIQVVGDSSYSTVTVSGAKNVVYGNHYGPRVFMRGVTRWHISPFGEALFGGSRADTTVSGTTTSQNCFSIKAGGGLDIRPSRFFEIRLLDVDYYRTTFGTNVHENNYWVSSGIVITLFRPWWSR